MLLLLFSLMTCTDFFGSRPNKKLGPYMGQPKSDLNMGHHTGPSLLTFIGVLQDVLYWFLSLVPRQDQTLSPLGFSCGMIRMDMV